MSAHPEERWAHVPGRPGYEASDFGRIRFYGEAQKQIASGGYMRVTNKIRKVGHLMVHILVLEAFVGPRPAGQQTRHLNGDGHDNRLANLVWGTPKENAADRRRHEAEREAGLLAPSRMSGRTVSITQEILEALDEFAEADNRFTRSNTAQYLIHLGLQHPVAQQKLAAYRAKLDAATRAASA